MIAPATRAAQRRHAVVDAVRRLATIVHDGRRWARLSDVERETGPISKRGLSTLVRHAKLVVADAEILDRPTRLVRLFGEESRTTAKPTTRAVIPEPRVPARLRLPGEPRIRSGPDLAAIDLVVELFEPGPEAALQLVRAGADHSTAVPHDGHRWAQVAVISISAPWIHREIVEAEERGLVVRGGSDTPGGRHVILARPAVPDGGSAE